MDAEKEPLSIHINDESDDDDNLNLITDIQITIKKLDGDTFQITISPSANVLGLKTLIHDQQNTAPNLQRLIYRAQELQDNFPLSQYGIQNNSTLHLVIRRVANINLNNNSNNDMISDNRQFSDSVFLPMQAEDMINVMMVVRLCRFVRIFALIDAIFLLIYGLQAFYFIILSLLALAGYWGAKNLDRKYLIMYGLCLILEVSVRSYMIYIDPHNVINIILLVLMILIDLFVTRCVVKLHQTIPLLNPDQRDRILILNRVGLI